MHALRALASTAPMRAIWADAAIYRTMLSYEATLADVQAGIGLIPVSAARAINQACGVFGDEQWQQLAMDGRLAGTAAIPLVKALKTVVSDIDPNAAGFVHFGSTSQDIADTALVMQLQRAYALLLPPIQKVGDVLATLAEEHKATPLLSRTLMQPAAPVSFGWKAAGWLDMWTRASMALHDVMQAAAVLQVGGANGASVALGDAADAVGAQLAQRLQLAAPVRTWQSARDRLVRVGNELALCCGILGKIGRDISLLMQSETAEVFEPSGAPGSARGGSSAMPHKRNPLASMHMLDAALRAPGLAMSLCGDMLAEHERGLGSWQNALPVLADLCMLFDNSVDMAADVLSGLQIDARAMQANIDRLHGVVFSETVNLLLMEHLGIAAAQRIVETASRRALAEQRDFRTIVREEDAVRTKVPAARLREVCGIDESRSACLRAASQGIAPAIAAWARQRQVLARTSAQRLSATAVFTEGR